MPLPLDVTLVVLFAARMCLVELFVLQMEKFAVEFDYAVFWKRIVAGAELYHVNVSLFWATFQVKVLLNFNYIFTAYLIATSSLACRNIKISQDSGVCAPIRKPRDASDNCNRIRCTIPQGQIRCYRSKKNNCQLLTSCQLARVNCRRGRSNRLQLTNNCACDGMQPGQKLQKCRRSMIQWLRCLTKIKFYN